KRLETSPAMTANIQILKDDRRAWLLASRCSAATCEWSSPRRKATAYPSHEAATTSARAAVPRTSQRVEMAAAELTSALPLLVTRDGRSVILGTRPIRRVSATTDDHSCIV